MPQYVVKGATVKRENIESQYGHFKSVDLHLTEYGQEQEIIANWYTKQDSQIPAVGSTFEGDISQSEYGPKIKRTPKQHAAGGGGGMTPERQRAIQRQHSQDMALRALDLAVRLNHPLFEVGEAKDFFALITKTADWFDRDVDRKANPQPEAQQ